MSYKVNESAVNKIKKLVVSVQTFDERGKGIRIGTGMFLDFNHIITANHVVREATEPGCLIKVVYNKSGQTITADAEVIYQSPRYDANILRIGADILNEDVEFVGMVPNSFRKREFSYSSYGFPNVKPEGHYQKGIILDESIDANKQLLIDVSLGEGKLNDYRGFSGSPVICNGQLIGIAIEQSVGLNAAQSIKVLDANTFVEILEKKWISKDDFIEEILENYRLKAKNEVTQNKRNGTYIPEIFVELGGIKEYLRGFSDPILFFDKHLDYVKRHHFHQYNLLLAKYGLPYIKSLEYESNVSLDSIMDISSKMIIQLKDMLNYIEKLTSSSKIREVVPQEYLDLFDISYYGHRLTELRWEIEDRIMLFKSVKSTQVLLTEKAGQGKTNLLCDFTDNVLLRKNIPCFFTSTRNLVKNNICDTLLDAVAYDITIDDLLEVLEFISDNTQMPFVIVLDAINEQKNVINAKTTLYSFLNKLKHYSNIKILMTARTEYFEEKFGDMFENCPQVELFDSYNLKSQHWKLNARVFDGYLEHFRISIDDIGDSIYDQLSRDFLLLRMFSEAYQGAEESNTVIPALLHLFRYEIFEKYYDYKKENLKEWDRMNGHLDAGSTYDNLIDTVIDYMIKKMQFSNIERSVIVSTVQNDLLVKLIDDDIVFRDDIIKQKGLVESNVEVINFTFDEFRDFCIAKKLMESFDEDNLEVSRELISRLTNPDTESAEGIQKYLFFASKKYRNKLFTELIVKQEWFYTIYFNNIFSVSEEYLEEHDITCIESVLTNIENYENHYITILNMYSNLIKRYNTKIYTKLNIRFLVRILEGIEDTDFHCYVHDIFRSSYEDRYRFERKRRIHIDKLIENMKVYFSRSFSNDIIYFLGYLDLRKVYIHDFFDWCIEEYPDETIIIFEEGLKSDDKLIVEVLQRIIRGISCYAFELNEKNSERWEKLKEVCKVKDEKQYSDLSNIMSKFKGIFRE